MRQCTPGWFCARLCVCVHIDRWIHACGSCIRMFTSLSPHPSQNECTKMYNEHRNKHFSPYLTQKHDKLIGEKFLDLLRPFDLAILSTNKNPRYFVLFHESNTLIKFVSKNIYFRFRKVCTTKRTKWKTKCSNSNLTK